jgi:N-sulfoglucosamine sulfohydrolase
MPHTPFSLMPCCDHAWMRESCAKEAVRCRRVSPFCFVALLLMLWAAPRSSDAADVAPTASGQPHIVMFVSDGHGYLDSPVYNPASRIRTPNLLRLSQLGTTYTHAFSSSANRHASQWSLHTGTMPTELMRDLDSHTDDLPLHPRSLSSHLKALGYRLIMVGEEPQVDAQQFPFEIIAETVEGPATSLGSSLSTDSRDTAPKFDLARWMRDAVAKDHRPLFVLINDSTLTNAQLPRESYAPYELDLATHWPDDDMLRIAQADYASRVTAMDGRLGITMDAAHEALPAEQTLFLYTSTQGSPLPYAQGNLYDAGVRVPLIALWNGHVRPGSRCDAMVSSIDILPTLVELAGGTPPSEIDGLSFASLLRNETYEHRDLVSSCVGDEPQADGFPGCSVRDRRFKYICNFVPQVPPASVARRFANLFSPNSPYRNRPQEELYDLVSDPNEQRNLAKDPAYQQDLFELREQLGLVLRRPVRQLLRLDR